MDKHPTIKQQQPATQQQQQGANEKRGAWIEGDSREIYRSTRPGKHFGIKSGHSGRVITLTTVAKSRGWTESKAEMHSRLDNVQQMPILGIYL
ncbi:hypothetical protein ACLKA6_000400 [Drosophila palustris]